MERRGKGTGFMSSTILCFFFWVVGNDGKAAGDEDSSVFLLFLVGEEDADDGGGDGFSVFLADFLPLDFLLAFAVSSNANDGIEDVFTGDGWFCWWEAVMGFLEACVAWATGAYLQ